jgi:hypothetical protein
VRILCPGLLSVATFGLMLLCLGGLSGCGDGKPADGTMVKEAAPLTDEQKVVHKKYYDPAKRAANRGGKR